MIYSKTYYLKKYAALVKAIVTFYIKKSGDRMKSKYF